MYSDNGTRRSTVDHAALDQVVSTRQATISTISVCGPNLEPLFLKLTGTLEATTRARKSARAVLGSFMIVTWTGTGRTGCGPVHLRDKIGPF